MLSSKERSLLEKTDSFRLWKDFERIASHNRLSGSPGERRAVEYIASRLEEENIAVELRSFPVRLSNPRKIRLSCASGGGTFFDVPAKAWSFTQKRESLRSRGRVRFIPPEELPRTFLDYLLERGNSPRDLEGLIAMGRSSNPFHLLSLQDRGAVGYIFCWNQGNEEEIHEGNVNMVWGTPLPEDLSFFLDLPFAAVNRPRGEELISLAMEGILEAEIEVELENLVAPIPLLEASIPAPSKNPDFLLLGNHLDSWHYGACDNATGNALCLELARKLKEMQPHLQRGVKIAWWSGHSNGRYAGSSAYAESNYENLLEHCMAYMNVDMPGLRGALDYSLLTAGPDLFDLGKNVLRDITGREGKPAPLVRGWDQSFQNLGISPYFIWASALPPGHPDSTGGTFMSRWWHTEKDLPEYCDPEVLTKDLSLYLLGAFRFLTLPEEGIYRPERLFDGILERLRSLGKSLGDFCSLRSLETILERSRKEYLAREKTKKISPDLQKQVLRKLNQIYYAEKPPYLQDYAIPEAYIPGLSMGALSLEGTPGNWENLYGSRYLRTQKNRIYSLGSEILFLCSKHAQATHL